MALFSDKTKAKAKVFIGKVYRGVKENAGLIFGGATVIAAWKGYSTSRRNSREIGISRQREEVLKNVVNNHADCIFGDRQKLLELEARQNELYKRALDETEGKAE